MLGGEGGIGRPGGRETGSVLLPRDKYAALERQIRHTTKTNTPHYRDKYATPERQSGPHYLILAEDITLCFAIKDQTDAAFHSAV